MDMACLVPMDIRGKQLHGWLCHCVGAYKPNPGSLQEQQALLTTQPSLQPPFPASKSLLHSLAPGPSSKVHLSAPAAIVMVS